MRFTNETWAILERLGVHPAQTPCSACGQRTLVCFRVPHYPPADGCLACGHEVEATKLLEQNDEDDL